MTDYENELLNLQIKGVMAAYDMANLFELLKLNNLYKVHLNRYFYLVKWQSKFIKSLIQKYNIIPAVDKITTLYNTPLTQDTAKTLVSTLINDWINWDTKVINLLQSPNEKRIFTNDLRTAQKYLQWYNNTYKEDNLPPLRQLMKSKLNESK